jgi:hypothetical protein
MRNSRSLLRQLLECQPGPGQARQIPSRRNLTWLTRTVQCEQADHYQSERYPPGIAPRIEAWLYRITIRRWWRPSITLWLSTVTVQVWAAETPVMLYQHHAFAEADAARLGFNAHRDTLRDALAHKPPSYDGPTLWGARESANVALDEVAAAADMSPDHLRKVEQGTRPVTPKVLAAYEQTTGLPLTRHSRPRPDDAPADKR